MSSAAAPARRGRTELLTRYGVLLAGLVLMAFGVALSVIAVLGTSPISALPYVVSLLTPLTVGTATIIMHVVMIGLQILILGRRYEPIQLLQLPVGVVFGFLIDGALWVLRFLEPGTYLEQLAVCLGGILIMGLGVTLQVSASVVMLAGEGLIMAVCRRWSLPFGRMKIINDLTLVAIAVVLSLIGLGLVAGVREGTIAAALLVGVVAGPIIARLKPALERRFR